VVKLSDTVQETGMNVRIYLIADAIVSIVDTRLRLPTETLLKGMQAGMQLERHYEWLSQSRHQMSGGPRHFCQDYLNNT